MSACLDLCYGSVARAYKSFAMPPLGSADHNAVLLVPSYKTVLKRGNVRTKCVRRWSDEAIARLQGCFESTDWDVFKETCTDLDDLTDTVSSYISFCEETVVEMKTCTTYPNNKPWVTKQLKSVLNRKRLAFFLGNPAREERGTEGGEQRD
ncbi:hypothetical protein BaRGS_00024488 [Batillaria attramentaria]|uniref:Uncharacterized protein n=1 Tax=Batillaria attramentaria TaxID=370345 RepID=A0ABD0KAT7_9CAEN